MAAFVRENQIVRRDVKGEQMKDIELSVMTEGRKAYYASSRRRVRHALTAPKQAALNDKRAWMYFGRLLDMNFGKSDYRITQTYKNLPASLEDAKKDFDRFIGRVKKLYRAAGIALKWVMIMSNRTKKSGELVRLHFHTVMTGGVDRTEIEKCWRAADKAGRCKAGEENKRLGAHLGFCNVDHLQVEGMGLAAHCEYMKKQPREGIARRWYSSTGLKKPYTYAPNDDKYDFQDLRHIAERNADAVDVGYWERQYPGWTVCEPREHAYKCTDSELSGISVLVKLRRLTEEEEAERKREREFIRKKRKERVKE